MKAFLISVCAILLLVAAITINGIYINNVTDNLLEMAERLSIENDEVLWELDDFWEKHEHKICISVSHKDVDNINIALNVLKEKSKNGDTSGFYEYKALLCRYITEIRNKERVHIDNII